MFNLSNNVFISIAVEENFMLLTKNQTMSGQKTINIKWNAQSLIMIDVYQMQLILTYNTKVGLYFIARGKHS